MYAEDGFFGAQRPERPKKKPNITGLLAVAVLGILVGSLAFKGESKSVIMPSEIELQKSGKNGKRSRR